LKILFKGSDNWRDGQICGLFFAKKRFVAPREAFLGPLRKWSIISSLAQGGSAATAKKWAKGV
jgi:hypothetical protein